MDNILILDIFLFAALIVGILLPLARHFYKRYHAYHLAQVVARAEEFGVSAANSRRDKKYTSEVNAENMKKVEKANTTATSGREYTFTANSNGNEKRTS